MSLPPTTWPGYNRSQSIESDGLSWHIERAGHGPLVLLLHGTGGSTHSWMDIVGELIHTNEILAVDLPGHGFTTVSLERARDREIFTIHGMASALHALLIDLRIAPTIVVGHSAGTPVLLQMLLNGFIAPARCIGLNPALVAPPTFYTMLMAPLVGAIVERDVIAESGAMLARATGIIELMLRSSGTVLTESQLERYRQLCTRPAHVHAALTMMSRWDLPRLMRDAAALAPPLEFYGGQRDRWVPPEALRRAAERLPTATLQFLDAGHLLAEEAPTTVLEIIRGAGANR